MLAAEPPELSIPSCTGSGSLVLLIGYRRYRLRVGILRAETVTSWPRQTSLQATSWAIQILVQVRGALVAVCLAVIGFKPVGDSIPDRLNKGMQ